MPDEKYLRAQIASLQAQIWKIEDVLLTLVAGALEEDEIEPFWQMVKEKEKDRLAAIQEIKERLN